MIAHLANVYMSRSFSGIKDYFVSNSCNINLESIYSSALTALSIFCHFSAPWNFFTNQCHSHLQDKFVEDKSRNLDNYLNIHNAANCRCGAFEAKLIWYNYAMAIEIYLYSGVISICKYSHFCNKTCVTEVELLNKPAGATCNTSIGAWRG